MGLDGVELIMNIENKFDIKVSDEEACQTTTVGKMYQRVLDKVRVSNTGQCSSQKAFYSLRKVLMVNLGIEKQVITPKTKTDLLFPEIERGELWEKVSVNAPYKFPELAYPSKAIIIIFLQLHPFFLPKQCIYAFYYRLDMDYSRRCIQYFFIQTPSGI